MSIELEVEVLMQQEGKGGKEAKGQRDGKEKK
jgi:hypothetical protein